MPGRNAPALTLAISASIAACAGGAGPVVRSPMLNVETANSTSAPDSAALCASTAKLLSAMKDQVTVTAYVTRGTPRLDAFVRDLEQLLRGYASAGIGKVEYEMVEVRDEETRRRAKEAGLAEQPMGDVSGDRDEAIVPQGFMGVVLRYRVRAGEVIKFLPPDAADDLELWITIKIREIRDKADGIQHRIGILVGHEEIAPKENNLVPSSMGKFSMQEIITKNFPFYALSDVGPPRQARPKCRTRWMAC